MPLLVFGLGLPLANEMPKDQAQGWMGVGVHKPPLDGCSMRAGRKTLQKARRRRFP